MMQSDSCLVNWLCCPHPSDSEDRMKDYVQYHDSKKRGRLTIRDSFLAHTQKGGEKYVGSRVWMISGEGQTKKDYFLRYAFVVDSFEEDRESKFKWSLLGKMGQRFEPWVQLSVYSWFPDFLRHHGNFGLGLSEIRDENVLHLRDLVASK